MDIKKLSYLMPQTEDDHKEKKLLYDYFGIDLREPIIKYAEDYPYLPDCVLYKLAEEETNFYKKYPLITNNKLLNRAERRAIQRQLLKNENKGKLKEYRNNKKKNKKRNK